MNYNLYLNSIIHQRCPPFIWDIIGYVGGIYSIYQYNYITILIYSCLFTLYGILNIIFDTYTVSFECKNDKFPTYKNLGLYQYYIINKKYKLNSKEIGHELTNNRILLDNSNLVVELNIYVGDHLLLKQLLYLIYIVGITKKSYTLTDIDELKEKGIRFF